MDISLEISGLIMAVAGAWALPWKISRDMRKDRELEAAKVLKSAQEEDAKLRLEFEAKIQIVQAELDNVKHDVEKDFAHVKETYNGALANLGQKIEELREQLNLQHSQLLSFLTKLVEKR
jgi:hypothetical protein